MVLEFNSLQSECTIEFAGQKLILHAAGVIYWVQENILIFSDLHLEKGSYFVREFPTPL
jgi:uncharacterized protein